MNWSQCLLMVISPHQMWFLKNVYKIWKGLESCRIRISKKRREYFRYHFDARCRCISHGKFEVYLLHRREFIFCKSFVRDSAENSDRWALAFLYMVQIWQSLGRKNRQGKYNKIKEALTVLLNIECKDLLPEGVTDNDYVST